MLSQYLLVILLSPLLGFIINGLIYKRASKNVVSVIACSSVLISFIFSILTFKALSTNTFYQYDYFNFIEISNIKIAFSLMADRLNVIYLLIITGIGFLIHLYSVGYMHEDKGLGKYFAYLNLFIFSMLMLVLGANYLILFIGWEGVGLCSFLLIGFWNHNKQYTLAARKAFIINRIGDLCFLIALFLLLANFNSLNFVDIKQNIGLIKNNQTLLNTITLLIFIGATGKSAQIPLFTWLPDAMAGPTPVSALIHAATMVTAGIFLISRSYFMFDLVPLIKEIITIVSLTTAFLAATIACTQNDIKKILAYSTVSQLGFMFLSIGVGNYEGAVFHVITHAFFKALLFLGAGSVIHAMHNEQNIQEMGNLKKKMPITHIVMLIACLAIVGIPGFSGFFSKDSILVAVYQKQPIYYFIALFAALLTTYYMFRMYFLTFYGQFRGAKEKEEKLHESPWIMTIPLIVLAFFSIVIGYINIPHILGGNSQLAQYLSTAISIQEIHLSPQVEIILMSVTFVLILGIIFYTKKIFSVNKKLTLSNNPLYTFFYNKWYVDEFYRVLIIVPIEKIGAFFKDIIEIKVIDFFVDGLGRLVIWSSRQIRYIQAGKIGIYAFWMLLGLVILFVFLLK